jgi:hypothetical protein
MLEEIDELQQSARLRSARDRANDLTAVLSTLETQIETIRTRHARAVSSAYDDSVRLEHLAKSVRSQLVNELGEIIRRIDKGAI